MGSYDDFHDFRLAVAQGLENGQWGSRFPVLMSHHDSDGEWSPAEATALAGELQVIETVSRSKIICMDTMPTFPNAQDDISYSLSPDIDAFAKVDNARKIGYAMGMYQGPPARLPGYQWITP